MTYSIHGGALLSLLSLSQLWACAPATDVTMSTSTAARAQALEELADLAVVGAGDWSEPLPCTTTCLQNHKMWVDLSVQRAPELRAIGVEYSLDEWATSQQVQAQFKGWLPDGRERWGVEVSLGIGEQHPPEVAYRAFAQRGDVVEREPRAHYLYMPVWPETPVRHLWSKLVIEDDGVALVGRVRVYDFDSTLEKRVHIRYTLDGWKTWNEVPATSLGGDDWSFEVDDLESAEAPGELPARVDFALRYSVPGEEFWDNAGSQNYHHLVAPDFAVFDERGMLLDPALPIGPLAGFAQLASTFTSELPVTSFDLRLDDGPWQDGTSIVLSTAGLDNGAHTLTLRAHLEGGTTSTTVRTLLVKNFAVPASAEPLPHPVDAPVLDVARTDDGALFVLYGNGVVAVRDGEDERLFYVRPGAQHIAVDDAHFCFIEQDMETGVVCTDLQGKPDRSWADRGRAELRVSSYAACPVALARDAGRTFVYDSCNARVVRFDEAGELLGVLPVEALHHFTSPAGLLVSDGALWLATEHGLTRIAIEGRAPMTVTSHVALPFLAGLPVQALARSTDGTFWAGTGWTQSIVAFTADGAEVGTWRGAGGTELGALESPRAILAADDGAVDVVAGDGMSLVRFVPLRGEAL